MNRSGRSCPAGPAITPHASSGWSARACAMILACSAPLIVSMDASVTGPRSGQRVHQGLLKVGQPVVDPHIGRTRIGRVDLAAWLGEVIRDVKTDAKREPDIIQRAQPRLRVGLRQPDPAA